MKKTDYFKNAEKIKPILNDVSPSFCLAKWTQVTLHLQNGKTHSCHHPTPHHIPIEEIEKDPSALHNTEYKKTIRQKMLDGKFPKECNYCFNIEKANPNFLSDRHLKSSEHWSEPHMQEILDNGADNFNPTYVEVSFANTCNFACSYCSPQISSKWMEDIKHGGDYDMGDWRLHNLDYLKNQNQIPIPEREHNPYVEAFWKWFPDLYPTLKVFRITGGEPLLSKHTWRVLDYIDQNPRPDLDIAINTNLGVPDNLIDRLIEYGQRFISENKVNRFEIYTSVEAWGDHAEYIRDGMNFNMFLSNLEKVATHFPMDYQRGKIVIMCTYNMLSVYSFSAFLEWIHEWRMNNSTPYWKKIWLDITYLRYPDWQTVQILPREHLHFIEESVNYMTNLSDEHLKITTGFQDVEIEKMQRVYEWAKLEASDMDKHISDFKHFFAEYDKRRGKSLFKTFPLLRGHFE